MLDQIKILNKSPAAIQITADQIILESVSRMKDRPQLPENIFQTSQEIQDLHFKRRQDWELKLRRNHISSEQFIRYAKWEESIGEVEKSRSVYERALEFSRYRDPLV
jgi:crooked neck